MNKDSEHIVRTEDATDTRQILIVPYMWIGDFVRGHRRGAGSQEVGPIAYLSMGHLDLCVRWSIHARREVWHHLGPAVRPTGTARQWDPGGAAERAKLRHRAILPRHEIGACADARGDPGAVGFVRREIGLINRWRWGEKALPRFIDKNAALALPDGDPLPPESPVPQLSVPPKR